MAEARGEQAIIGQRVGVARKPFQHFLVERVSVGVTAGRDHRASSGLLQCDAAGIEGDGANERCDGLVVLPLLRFGASDALFDEAVIRINLRGAQKSRKISFVGAQREMELIEAAPEEQHHGERNSKRGSRKNARRERANGTRRTRRYIGCSSGRFAALVNEQSSDAFVAKFPQLRVQDEMMNIHE